MHFSDRACANGDELLSLVSQLKWNENLKDIILNVANTDRIHYVRAKDSLSFSFKSRIGAPLLIQSTVRNLGVGLKKLKISAKYLFDLNMYRELDLKDEDVGQFRLQSELKHFKFRVKTLKSLVAVNYLELFNSYVQSSGVSMVSMDLKYICVRVL